MGHDGHFLSRLDRLTSHETDFALALYRDHEVVKWVLNRARVPDNADRVAIALGDDEQSPHVIVARDGGFVTCLGRGMSIAGRPRIKRSELDRLVNESRSFHARWSALRNDNTLSHFVRLLKTGGSRIAREDFRGFVDIAPILEVTYCRLWVEMAAKLEESIRKAIREVQKKYPDESVLHRYWLDYHVTEHALVLAGPCGSVFERLRRFVPDGPSFSSTLWGVGRFGMLSSFTRVAWAAGQLKGVVRDGLFEMLAEGDLTSHVFTAWPGAVGLVLSGDDSLAKQALEWFSACDKSSPDLRSGAVADVVLTRQRHDTRLREGLDAVRDRWTLLQGDSFVSDLADDELLDLAPALLGSADYSIQTAWSEGFQPLLRGAPHLVHGLSAEMLYPPRKYLDVITPPWTPEATKRLLALQMTELRADEPARVSVRVGRNEKCPCGSGTKFKRCCAA